MIKIRKPNEKRLKKMYKLTADLIINDFWALIKEDKKKKNENKKTSL